MDSETRPCQNCRKDFVIETEDLSFYKKLKVSAPTWCPDCRYMRKLTFINERSLYKSNCGSCGKFIISMYGPESEISSWCVKCHISDKWDARDYGKDYDFSRTFFEQFKDLKYSLPHRALDHNERNGEGCDYSNMCYSSKNIYLSFNTAMCEELKYCNAYFKRNKNCLDSIIIAENDRGYELVQANNNYNSSFLVDSNQCVDSHFLYDCSNCVNCCMSSNLRNKSYVFRNKQLSREEYIKAVNNLQLGTYSGQMIARKEFDNVAINAVHKHAHIKNSINTTGDLIENSKNVHNCFGITDGENVKFSLLAANTIKDSQDAIYVGRIEECYEYTHGGRQSYRSIFCLSCGGGCRNLLYCDSCRSSSDCFGCVNLLNKQYCILNKQYSKEEYFELVEKIKKHMDEMPYTDKAGRVHTFGEFFPTDLSPFSYNETIAFEERNLSKEEIFKQGYKWKDVETKQYVSTIKSTEVSDDIKNVEDFICNEAIECPNLGSTKTQCTSAYRILPDELQFYRRMNLPIPRLCPNCRYYERLKWKNPFKFYTRECACEISVHGHPVKCPNEFETMYAPDRPEKIFCKECYQKEIY